MGRLRDWWARRFGRDEPSRTAATPVKRPVTPPPVNSSNGTLELADPPAKRKPSRAASAGFDPYANDAGYSKPRGWERVERE